MMASTLVFAAATLALAYARNLPFLCAMLISGGAAWLTLMSSFNVAVQDMCPFLVRARVLGFYTLVFQGGLALSSAAWVAVAQRAGNNASLAVCGCRSVPEPGSSEALASEKSPELDLRPSLNWG